MTRGRGLFIAASAAALYVCVLSAANPHTPGSAKGALGGTASSLTLQTARKSPSDLELGGDLAGVPASETRYASRQFLLARPQHEYPVSDDSNFPGPMRVSGVLLDHLLRDLSGSPTEDMVVAICDDKYDAYYPQEYLALHHPLLVLKINGQPPSRWPKSHGNSMGPYLVSHPKFVPSFRVLSDDEEPQIPWAWYGSNFATKRS